MFDKVITIAREAGEIVRTGFKGDFSIEYKTNETNLVTEVDKKSEAVIIDFIKKNFRGHSILAEESGKEDHGGEYTWVIDPLDGTTNFAHGLPIFSVSIGVQKHAKTVCGVVYDVMRDAMYSAELGSGAFRGSTKISVSENSKIGHSVLVTGFPYDIVDNPNNAVEKFTAFLKKSRGVRRLGSAAIDLCYVAEGVFEGFWEVHLHPWDMCAGKLIVEEAGGRVTNFNNDPININSKELLATNGLVHREMVKILQEN